MRKIYYKGTRLYRKEKDWVIAGRERGSSRCVGPDTFETFSQDYPPNKHWNLSVKHSIYRLVKDGDGMEYARFKNHTQPVTWIT